MKKLSLWIASLFLKNHLDTRKPAVRTGYGLLEGWVSIVGNIALFIIKLVAGIKVHSTALIADAVHTLSDSLTSGIVIAGFKMASKPSDKEHPFGHGRIEPIATLVISVLLFVAGIELIKSSVDSIMHPVASKAGIPVIILVSGTIIVKELMARFSFALGDIIDSDTLKADALHHRSDAFSTLLVIVALVASRYGYHSVDGIMGIGVSLVIFASAWSIAKEAVNPLIGEAPSEAFLKKIESTCLAIPGVMGVHDIIAHQYGQVCIISVHIEVSDRESAITLHELCEDVEAAIYNITGEESVVHLDPINWYHPQVESVRSLIRRIVSEDERIDSYSDLRIIGKNLDRGKFIFDIALADHASESQTQEIVSNIEKKIKKTYPGIESMINASTVQCPKEPERIGELEKN